MNRPHYKLAHLHFTSVGAQAHPYIALHHYGPGLAVTHSFHDGPTHLAQYQLLAVQLEDNSFE